MSSSSTLYLKYRPQTFDDVVGQQLVIRTLRNALKLERPAHAYLFAGSRGTGKTSTARIFAKGLNCTNLQDGNPCGVCEFCTGTAEGSLVDVIEIDAASNRKIDEVRQLRERIIYAPNFAKRKVYIIDEVHMLTTEAFNALLKTLEEPPSHAFFVLATTELHKIPATIRSRCQTFSFGKFTLPEMVERLGDIATKEGFSTDETALTLIARHAEGGMRDALSALEQVAAENDGTFDEEKVRVSLGLSSPQTLQALWDALEAKDIDAGFTIVRDLVREGRDIRSFGHEFLNFLREKLHESLRTGQGVQTVLHRIELTEAALRRLQHTPILELPLEILVVQACSVDGTPAPAASVVAPPKPVPTPQPPKPEVPTPEKTIPPVEQPESSPAPEPQTHPDANSERHDNVMTKEDPAPVVAARVAPTTPPSPPAQKAVETPVPKPTKPILAPEPEAPSEESPKRHDNVMTEAEPAPVVAPSPPPSPPTNKEVIDGFVFDAPGTAPSVPSPPVKDSPAPQEPTSSVATPPVATASAQTAPEKAAATLSLTDEGMRKAQQTIANIAALTPGEKSAFLQGMPHVSGTKITFRFNAQIFLNKIVQSTSAVPKLTDAVRKFFHNEDIILAFEKRDDMTTPEYTAPRAVSEKPTPAPSSTPTAPQAEPTDQAVGFDDLKDLF